MHSPFPRREIQDMSIYIYLFIGVSVPWKKCDFQGDLRSCCSVDKLCLTLCDPMNCSMPGFPVLHYLPGFAQTHVRWVGDAIRSCHPLLLPSSLALSPSEYQGLLSQLLASGIQSIGATASASSLSNEYSGLISFRVDWFALLAVQGTLKSLLQHHSSKASVLQCSAFFVVQLTSTHTTGKNVVLTIWTFIGKVMSLLFNILSRFVTAILQFLR